jgi:Dockerin type I domain
MTHVRNAITCRASGWPLVGFCCALLQMFFATMLISCATPVEAQRRTTIALVAAETRVLRLAAGQSSVQAQFALDATTTRVNVEIRSPRSDLVPTLVLPSGAVLAADNAAAFNAAYVAVPQGSSVGLHAWGVPNSSVYHWIVPIAQSGLLNIRVAAPHPVDADLPVVVHTVSDSALRAAAIPVPNERRPGDPVILAAAMFNGTQPVFGATVRAVVMNGTRVESSLDLFDNGQGVDAAASDGIYSAAFRPDSDGPRTIGYTATTMEQGLVITRQAASTFEAWTPSAKFHELQPAQPWKIEDTNGDGRTDRMTWRNHVNVIKAGPFRLFVGLRSGDKRLTATSEQQLPVGVSAMGVSFTSQRLESEGVGAGHYEVEHLELQDLSDNKARVVARHDSQRIGPDRVIDLTGVAFDRTPLLLRGSPRFFGSDANSRGLWRKLVFEVEVDSTVTDFISASATLFSGARMVATCAGTRYARVGITRLGMDCSGRDVGSLGIDGPYEARGLWAYRVNSGPPATLQVSDTFATSGPIRSSEFEGSDRRPEDVNADGIITCFDLSLVRAHVGLRAADIAFDPRLDVNRDGAIGEADIELVRRALPAGVTCPVS